MKIKNLKTKILKLDKKFQNLKLKIFKLEKLKF